MITGFAIAYITMITAHWLTSLVLFALAFWLPVMMKLGAVTLFVSMVLLEINLVLAYKNYGEIRKRKPDFDMSGMQ